MKSNDLHLFKAADNAIRSQLATDLADLATRWERADYNGMRHRLEAMRQHLSTIAKALPEKPDDTADDD